MVVNNDLIANFHGLLGAAGIASYPTAECAATRQRLVFGLAMTANATVTVALLLILMALFSAWVASLSKTNQSGLLTLEAIKLRLATLFCLAVAIPGVKVTCLRMFEVAVFDARFFEH